MERPSTKINLLFFLLLTTLLGTIFFLPNINYQRWLSQGDHGLNLYAAQAILNGDVPYRDFHWFYGPLMPYFYSLMFLIFGESISSVLLGKAVLSILSGLFIYLSLSLFVSRYISFIAALWFWVCGSNIFYTYNHVGGQTLSLFVFLMLCAYIKMHRQRFLNIGLFACFCLSLIKFNIGMSVLASLILSVFVSDLYNKDQKPSPKKLFYLNACITVPIISVLSNWLFVYDQPFYVIKQCFQYFGNDAFGKKGTYPSTDLFQLLLYYVNTILKNWTTIFLSFITILSGVYLIVLMQTKKISLERQRNALILGTALIIFFILNFHEFLLSSVFFRTFWSESYVFILIFLIIGLSIEFLSKFVKGLLFITFFFIVFIQYIPHHLESKNFRNPQHYLVSEKAKIYLGNEQAWIDAVSQTTMFLDIHLNDDELFFALPYDPLYYFLADKPSPTRQLVFFDFLNIPEEQEQSIIKELENNDVNWVVLSNRMRSDEPGAEGVLGQTYCPLIGDYLTKNFETFETFGEWDKKPTWIKNHSVRILKRK